MGNKPRNTFFVVDENIQTKNIVRDDHFLFCKRGAKDEAIIGAINTFSNHFVIFTKNDKDFRGIDKSKDQVCRVAGDITQDTLDRFIPKMPDVFSHKSTLKRHPFISLSTSVTQGTKKVQLVSSSTGTPLLDISTY